jgi:RHS repeat-associated protein
VTQYTYDGSGQRVVKAVCTSGANPCTALVTGARVTTYVYDAQGNLAAEYGLPTDSGTKYLIADALGSTRLTVDGTGNVFGTGNVTKCLDYTPFGEEIPQGVGGRGTCYGAVSYPGNPDTLAQKFTGKERDAETGLDYFGARYFSGAQGRFTSADKPFADQHGGNPQSWNLYTYVGNNPLAKIDQKGTDAIWIQDNDKNQTTLVIRVQFSGPGATKENIAKIVNRDNALDTGGSPVKIQVIAIDKGDKRDYMAANYMDLSPGLDHKRYGDVGEGTAGLGGREAHINSADSSLTDGAAHDILHFAGISDQYKEGPRDSEGRRANTTNPGYEGNVMAESRGTKLKPEQIEEANKNPSTRHCTVTNGVTECH